MNEYQDYLIQKMRNMSKSAQKELLSKNISLKKVQIKELKRTRIVTSAAFIVVLLMNIFIFVELMLISTTFVKIATIINVACLVGVSYFLGINTKYRDRIDELNFQVNTEEDLLLKMNMNKD